MEKKKFKVDNYSIILESEDFHCIYDNSANLVTSCSTLDKAIELVHLLNIAYNKGYAKAKYIYD